MGAPNDFLVYPAIFRPDGKSYEVIFPDIPFETCGSSLDDAFLMACDLLHCVLCDHVVPGPGWELPAPTPFWEVKRRAGDIVLLVRPAIYERSGG